MLETLPIEQRNGLHDRLGYDLARTDPQLGLTWATSIQGAGREEAVQRLFEEWSGNAPAAVIKAHDTLESEEDRQAALVGIARGWAIETSGRDELRLINAYQYASEITDDSKRAQSIKIIAYNWADKYNIDNATAFFSDNAMSDADRAVAMAQIERARKENGE